MRANCTSDACEKHNTFGDEDSNTLKATGSTFNLTYGTGFVSGVTVNDTVEIALRTSWILISFPVGIVETVNVLPGRHLETELLLPQGLSRLGLVFLYQ